MIEVLKQVQQCLKDKMYAHAEMYLSEAIAELESQEPDAWRIKVETKLRDGSVDVGYQLRNEKLSVYDEPLYTHSSQRTWVGLTDEEAQQTFARHNCTISTHLAGILTRAIEAKLKEKNT